MFPFTPKKTSPTAAEGSFLSSVLVFFVLLLSIQACDKNDGVPAFVGLWEYWDARPAEHVEPCYTDTWFEITIDNRFQLFDPCEDEMITGTWHLNGMEFEVSTDYGSHDGFSGSMLAVNDQYMLIEVIVEDQLTEVMFKKIGSGVP